MVKTTALGMLDLVEIFKKLKVMLFLLLEIDLKPWQPQ